MERINVVAVITADVRLSAEEIKAIRELLGESTKYYELFKSFANLDDYIREIGTN